MMDRNARPILELAPTQWARFVLRMSPAAGSIDEKEALRLASLALHAGRTASIKIPFGATPYDFADDLGILIFFNQDLRPEIRFAECHTLRGKTTITVFEENLHRIQHAITEAASLGVEIDLDPLELILWHELFHGMEHKSLYTDLLTARAELCRLGPFTRTCRLRSLSEIGAMAFACSACNWNFNPLILNYWLLASYDKQEAERFAHALLSNHGHVQLSK